jgi:DtxR family transcriptional regulator, Mn-dependent transcriptional regulator
MNATTEDYLCTIYSILEKNKSNEIKSIALSKELKIARASVSSMAKKLAEKGYIKFNKYSKITLTPHGKKHAKKMMHKHRIIEVFLVKLLGHTKNKVHTEAHKLEHAFSDKSIKKIDQLLNHPKKSPFGKPIPRTKTKK